MPASTDDTARPFRRISVTVNVPGLRVITREGYFAGVEPVSAVSVGKEKQAKDVRYDLMAAARHDDDLQRSAHGCLPR